MDYHIISEPSSKIREIARNALAGYWKPVFLGIFIYSLLTSGVSQLLDTFFYYDYDLPIEYYGVGSSITQQIGYGGNIYDLFTSGAFSLGLAIFMLTFFRSKKTDNTLIFDGFSSFGKALLAALIMGIKIFLWSMLLVVTGIIAAIRYSQTFFVMADHPEYSANECIEESKRLMMGNKARFFCLHLSFIGWYILAAIPTGIILNIFDGDGVLATIIAFLASIPLFLVSVYVETANTAFYELATQRLVVVGSDSRMESDRVVNASYSVDEQTEEAADAARTADTGFESPETANEASADTISNVETETKPDDENKPEGNILQDEKIEDYTDKTDV